MKVKELNEKTIEALKQDLAERQRRLFDLRTQGVTEKVQDTSQFAKTRRDVAQIKTIIRQKQMARSK